MLAIRPALAALALSLLVGGPTSATADEQVVNVSVVAAPGDSEAGRALAAEDARQQQKAEAARLEEGFAPEGTAHLTVKAADTLGPAYKVIDFAVSVGPTVLGHIEDFGEKRKQRRQLRVGPSGDVDARYESARIKAVVRGVGSGDFAWLNKYEYTIQWTCPVALEAGAASELVVKVVRDAGPMADFGEGLGIACE